MTGPAGVMALVLAQIAAGGGVLLWADLRLWGEVKHGFYKVTGMTVGAIGFGTWATLRAATEAPSSAIWLALGASVVTGVAVVLLFARSDTAARVAGLLTVPAWTGLIATLATTSTDDYLVALFRLVAGAAFIGSVLDGMLLGHWYLTDRKLTRVPINRWTNVLIGSVVAMAAAVFLAGFAPTPAGPTFNPILTSTGLANWIALGMVTTCGMIALLIRSVLKGERASAVQSATGFYYLAVICALVAVSATMVNFLPGA